MDKKKLLQNESFERLEESLYNPANPETKFRRGILHKKQNDTPHSWGHIDEEIKEDIPLKKNSGFLKKFFLSSLLFFLVAIGFGAYEFFLKGKINPEENIEIGILGSTFSQAGEDLPLTIEIFNKNNFSLELVDLVAEVPKTGVAMTGSSENTERTRISVGTIEPGKRHQQELPVVLYGKEGDTREVLFTLEYHIPNSSAIFQKQKSYAVVLSSSPVIARINALPVAVPNETYTFSVDVTTNTKKPLENVLVVLEYPVGFEYQSSNLEPMTSNNVWDFETLLPGTTKTIEITGKFLGQEGDEKSIRSLIGTYLSGERKRVSTTLATLIHTTALQKPFLSTTLSVNNDPSGKVSILPGSQIQGEIFWKNNLPTKILDAEIQIKLVGDLFERSEVDPIDGFYNSSIDSIIWNKNTFKEFSQIPVGASGSFQFTVPTLKPKADGTIKNPNIEFEIYVKGIEDGTTGTLKKIEAREKVTVRLIADTTAFAESLYSTGPLTNSGPFPPKVNTETTFTAFFYITNKSNDISQAEIKAKLPPNVIFSGIVSPNTEKVILDERTGELFWRPGSIKQTSSEIARSVYLQLKVLPSLTQVGSPVTLLSGVQFKATDMSTGKVINEDLGEVTSETAQVPGEDQSFGNGRVVN